MGKGGNKRDWGYASCDDDDNLTYTSYEKDGSVNRYKDNGDGGHSHSHWKNKDNYNSGKSADSTRTDSNKSSNPSTGEVQDNGGCYLTSACMSRFQSSFDDNCYELQTLRSFRDDYVSKEDIEHYYQTAPLIVNSIDDNPNSESIYRSIYENVISFCVKAIEDKKHDLAYEKYRECVLSLEETYLKPTPVQ